MVSKTNVVIFTLIIYLFETNSVSEFLFDHRSRHDILWTSDCNSKEALDVLDCANICIHHPVCLNFAYSKSESLCNYNCRIFWSRNATDVNWTYYERISRNLALLKPVSRSSLWNSNPIHVQEFAVDGVLSPRIWAEECFHSDSEVSPWIQVDLGIVNVIDYIKIFNRWDEYGEKLHNVKVQIDGNDGECTAFVGPASNSQVVFIPCESSTSGRRVKLYIDGITGESNALMICELEICQFL